MEEESYDYLIQALEKSVEKNGEIKMTNKHLLNLLKMVDKKINRDAYYNQFPSVDHDEFYD